MCSEATGGVHQICVTFDESTKDFAQQTFQPTNWSRQRVHRPHCVCLGAYALYHARASDAPLTTNCRAIPETVFDPSYVQHWATWNGHQLPRQIVHGVDALYRACDQEAQTSEERNFLRTRYQNIRKAYS